MSNENQQNIYSMQLKGTKFNADLKDHMPRKLIKANETDKMGYLDYYDKYLMTNNFVACSIDPGIKGGIAFLEKTDSSIIITTHRIPVKLNSKLEQDKAKGQKGRRGVRRYFVDPLATYELMKSYMAKSFNGMFYFGIIEQVHAFPQQGIVSTFNFGKESGMVEALLWVTSKYLYHVHIPSWKKRFDLKGKKTDRRGFLRLLQSRLQQIINHLSQSVSPRRLVINTHMEHDGELEAIFLMLYSLEKLKLWEQMYHVSLPAFSQ
jgi:hypothetical protein